MKFISALICTAVLAFALSLFLPWWAIAIAAFLVACFLRQAGWKAFTSAFIAVFLLWAAICIYINAGNPGIMAQKTSVLILKNNNPQMLILITALIGAFTAGFAGLTGSLFTKMFKRKEAI